MNPWPRVRLDECTTIISGATPETSESSYWGGDICWATPKDLSELNGAYISDTPRKITRRGLESCAASVLPPESVLFSSRAPIGHVAINTVPMATNQGFKSFIPNHERINAKFLYHWIRKNRPYLERLGNGATFKEISKAVVSRIEIDLPPVTEQRRIAEILDKADALRAKRRAALAKLDTLTQSIFLDMFGDPATNPKGWPLRSLGACTEKIQIGPFGSQLHQADYIEGGIPLVNPKHIQHGTLAVDASDSLRPKKYAQLRAYQLHPGDVIMGRRGEMGRCAVVLETHGHLLCGTGSLFLRPDCSAATSGYLQAVLSSAASKAKFERLSLGQTLPNLNLSIIENFEIPLPPACLQTAYDQIISAIALARGQQVGSLSQFNAFIASLQYRAFRGEL